MISSWSVKHERTAAGRSRVGDLFAPVEKLAGGHIDLWQVVRIEYGIGWHDVILWVSRDRLVNVDEASHDFVHDPACESMLLLVKEGYKNVSVSRTASKIRGLAGIKTGRDIDEVSARMEETGILSGRRFAPFRE